MNGTPEPILSSAIDNWDAAEYLRKRQPQAQYARRSFDREWYRNALFFLGQQWIKFARSSQQWRPLNVPDWFPKQVTNKYAVAIDMMKSVFSQSDPVSIFSPASSEVEDLSSAQVAEDISKCIELEVEQSRLESALAAWIVITGNGFILDGYDGDPRHGTKFIPDMMCLQCAIHIPAEESGNGCPQCGGNGLMEAMDGDGQPIGKEMPVGRMFSEICSPFEIHLDLVSQSLESSPYVYRARTYPISVLEDMFPDYAKKFKGDDAGVDSGMFYQTALAYITSGTTTSPGNYSGSVGSVDNVPRATLYHLWVRPTKDLPNGGEALLVGDQCVWKSELTAHDERGNPTIPLTQFGFNNVPGRIFAKSPASDLVYKQIQLNKIEAFIQLSIERTGNPVWLLPKGIGLEEISGQPGEKIWFNWMGGNGAKPERLGGSELPGAVFRWLDAIEKAMMDIAHTGDVFKGQNPKSVTTFGATQILLERGYAGFAEALKSWGMGWNQVRRNRLNLWKEYASDERTMMVLGENKKWEAKKFSKDSIKGRINVYLEEASVAPKSKAYDQLATAQLIENGLVNIQDPAVRMQVMSTFDAAHLVEDIDIDIKDAVKEKEMFLASGQVRPRATIDNHPIHSLEHKKFAKSDAFLALPPQVQQAWVEHIAFHDQIIQQQQQAQQMQDPHLANAKARLEQVQLEVQALGQSKKTEIEHKMATKAIDLKSHAVKKAIDIQAQAAQARIKAQSAPSA